MKIGVFIEQYGLGGTDVHLANLLNQWPEAKDEFYCITNEGNKGMKLFTSIMNRQYQVDTIKNRFYGYYCQKAKQFKSHLIIHAMAVLFLLIAKYPLFVFNVFYLMIIIKRYKFDVFISDNGGYPASDSCRAALLSSYFCGIKRRYLIVHHKAIRPAKHARYLEWIIDKLLQAIVNNIITVSNASKLALLEERYFTKKIEVIYNGLEETSVGGSSINLRRTYDISAQKKLVGIMGNIEPHKGHLTMIAAAPLILERFPDTHFIFVGSLFDDNWQRQHADNVIAIVKSKGLAKHVTITGFLDGQSQDIIKQFDILAMPTLDFEGFGLVLAEAMILRKPIVASCVGAIPEVLVDGQSGLLVQPGNPVVLATAICELLANPALRNKLGLIARKRYEEHFTAKTMAARYYSLIKQ